MKLQPLLLYGPKKDAQGDYRLVGGSRFVVVDANIASINAAHVYTNCDYNPNIISGKKGQQQSSKTSTFCKPKSQVPINLYFCKSSKTFA